MKGSAKEAITIISILMMDFLGRFLKSLIIIAQGFLLII